MKKLAALLMALMMLVPIAVASASAQTLSLDDAKKTALSYVGVSEDAARFTKAHLDWDDGRQVYEIEFYVDNVEYDMDVDAATGRITDFSQEYHGQAGYGRYGYDDDWDDDHDDFDWDDIFDWD